ncbi:MAG: hypothetical protein ABJB32_03855 [Verrucomicrobiota bacterium]
MKRPRISRRKRALIECAPITEAVDNDRAMRSALKRAKTVSAEELNRQQDFDRAIAALVGNIPIPAEIEQWFASENLFAAEKHRWMRTALQPAILAIGLALLVMAAIFVFTFMEHLHDFPGSAVAKKLLVVAKSARRSQFETLNTDAINLSDYFFMKYQLEHFDVPIGFADFRATGARVFEDEDGHRIAQVGLTESGMQFFLFATERGSSGHTPVPEFSGWHYVEGEGWSGAVQEHNGVYFMVAMRGSKQDLEPYLSQRKK